MKKTVTTNVRIPADWLKMSIDDIMITVTATINEVEDTIDVSVKQIIFPGWHSFNIRPGYQHKVYELVEQKCMDAYTARMDYQYDYETYPDYVI
jgi:hypothetical protein